MDALDKLDEIESEIEFVDALKHKLIVVDLKRKAKIYMINLWNNSSFIIRDERSCPDHPLVTISDIYHEMVLLEANKVLLELGGLKFLYRQNRHI